MSSQTPIGPPRFYGQFSNPQVDEYLFKRFFSHCPRNGVIIEAGAEDGHTIPNSKFFEEYLGWTAINIEPNPVLYNKLIHNRPRSSSINLQYALSSKDKSGQKLDFQSYNVGLGYLIDEVPENHKEFTNRFAGNRYPKTGIISVECISYEDLVIELDLKKVDALVLDVEGSELKILQSLSECSIIPSVICVEDNLDEKDFFDEVLLPIGYKFDQKVHINLYYYLHNTR